MYGSFRRILLLLLVLKVGEARDDVEFNYRESTNDIFTSPRALFPRLDGTLPDVKFDRGYTCAKKCRERYVSYFCNQQGDFEIEQCKLEPFELTLGITGLCSDLRKCIKDSCRVDKEVLESVAASCMKDGKVREEMVANYVLHASEKFQGCANDANRHNFISTFPVLQKYVEMYWDRDVGKTGKNECQAFSYRDVLRYAMLDQDRNMKVEVDEIKNTNYELHPEFWDQKKQFVSSDCDFNGFLSLQEIAISSRPDQGCPDVTHSLRGEDVSTGQLENFSHTLDRTFLHEPCNGLGVPLYGISNCMHHSDCADNPEYVCMASFVPSISHCCAKTLNRCLAGTMKCGSECCSAGQKCHKRKKKCVGTLKSCPARTFLKIDWSNTEGGDCQALSSVEISYDSLCEGGPYDTESSCSHKKCIWDTGLSKCLKRCEYLTSEYESESTVGSGRRLSGLGGSCMVNGNNGRENPCTYSPTALDIVGEAFGNRKVPKRVVATLGEIASTISKGKGGVKEIAGSVLKHVKRENKKRQGEEKNHKLNTLGNINADEIVKSFLGGRGRRSLLSTRRATSRRRLGSCTASDSGESSDCSGKECSCAMEYDHKAIKQNCRGRCNKKCGKKLYCTCYPCDKNVVDAECKGKCNKKCSKKQVCDCKGV